jgi:hypothetical protein
MEILSPYYGCHCHEVRSMVGLGSTVQKVVAMLQIPHFSAMKANPGFMTASYYIIHPFTRILFPVRMS